MNHVAIPTVATRLNQDLRQTGLAKRQMMFECPDEFWLWFSLIFCKVTFFNGGLLVIGGIWLAIWLVIQIIKYVHNLFRPTASSRPEVRPGTGVQPPPPRKDVYRP